MPSEEEKPFSVAIVGGGIAGLTLAVACLTRGIKVDIYEKAAKYGEIGAGVAFSPNALQAMKLCHQELLDACNKVATTNQSQSKKKTWFDWVDGYNHAEGEESERWCFNAENSVGAIMVHRAHFLDEVVKLVPKEVSHFGKHLETVEEDGDGKMTMKFADGTTASADAVIGCDGIKSKVRQLLLGKDNPASYPHYSHKYAYRGLIPMDKAVQAIGEETATNSNMHMGPNGHLLTFPVARGKTMNVVAFRHNPDPWPDTTRLVMPSQRSVALREFEGWGVNVTAILKMLDDNLDCWGLFDTFDYPAPTYYRGRLCISGDAAHATTPHMGAGAGYCVEDSAVMADMLKEAQDMLLKGSRKTKTEVLEAVFGAFDESRRERTQWLVRNSRDASDLYEWRYPGVGDDTDKIGPELTSRAKVIWDVDVEEMIEDAKQAMKKRLA